MAATSDLSKPFFPLAGGASDGYTKEDRATATCFCGAVQLEFVGSAPEIVSGFGFEIPFYGAFFFPLSSVPCPLSQLPLDAVSNTTSELLANRSSRLGRLVRLQLL